MPIPIGLFVTYQLEYTSEVYEPTSIVFLAKFCWLKYFSPETYAADSIPIGNRFEGIMDEVPLFKQPSKMLSISSQSIARNLVNCMGCHIGNIAFDWKADNATEHLNALTKWLDTVKDWWENDITVDPCSPMHETMKGAIMKAAAEKWKNKDIAWSALLISYLFDSVTIDCICQSTDELSHEVDEELYQEVLTRVSPLALKRLKLVSNKLYAWQTRIVRDLLHHSPNVMRVEVPVLSHYILDGISKTPNLEELEIIADMYYSEIGKDGGVLAKAAQVFLGSKNYYDLMEKIEEEGRRQLSFPRLKKFYIDVVDYHSSFCHAMVYMYPDVKLKSFYLPEEEYLLRFIEGEHDAYWGIGSLFAEAESTRFGKGVMNVKNFIIGDCLFYNFEDDLSICSGLKPTNLIIFYEIKFGYEFINNLLKNWTTVEKLGVKNVKFLETIKDSYASQILCIELEGATSVLEAFGSLAHFPNLKHLMFAYPACPDERWVNTGRDQFSQVKELTITFQQEVEKIDPELLHLIVASFPNVETLHLRNVTCSMWTNNYLKYCGHASVKNATLIATEQLYSCQYFWLDAFPSLEGLTIKSTVPQNNHFKATSRLNIKYEGIVVPHDEWQGDYESNSDLYPEDELVSIAKFC
ncbi:uncharacterized protein LOC143021617 [Oratosquilla oratoria]|uniref:uncharacterized protein LOC143021617 n=1 Tax=Oratosquilla oratoria TaxID=337810 RepID=UPI003F76FD3B